LRFAVHRPGYPVASPRSHRMPCGDVPGRVHVSVAGIPAGHAAEQGLALAAARCDVPARRATLTRVRRTYLLHPAGGFVFYAADQQAPPAGQNAPVQPGLLPHIAARFLRSAPRGAGHVPDLQVFDADHVKPPSKSGRGLLAPVLASVGLTGLVPSDDELDPFAPRRSAPRLGQLAFQSSPAPPLPRRRYRTAQQLPGRQSRRHDHATVEANDPAISRCGYPHLGRAAVQSAHVTGTHLGDAEPLVTTRLPPRWAVPEQHCLLRRRELKPVSGHAATVLRRYDIPPRPEGRGILWRSQ
jgi:hypothetical protein